MRTVAARGLRLVRRDDVAAGGVAVALGVALGVLGRGGGELVVLAGAAVLTALVTALLQQTLP